MTKPIYILKERITQDVWNNLSCNVESIHLLEQYHYLIQDWSGMSMNGAAELILRSNMEKVNRQMLQSNPAFVKEIEIVDMDLSTVEQMLRFRSVWNRYIIYNPRLGILPDAKLEEFMRALGSHFFSENPSMVDFLKRNPSLIDWAFFSRNINPKAIDMVVKEYKRSTVINTDVFSNPAAYDFLQKIRFTERNLLANPAMPLKSLETLLNNLENIMSKTCLGHYALQISSNPSKAAMELLRKRPNYIVNNVLAQNIAAGPLLEDLINEGSIVVGKNIESYFLISNPGLIILCQKYSDQIEETMKCYHRKKNYLPSKEQHELVTEQVRKFIGMYTRLDYEAMQKNNEDFREELISYVLYPCRVKRVFKFYGYKSQQEYISTLAGF